MVLCPHGVVASEDGVAYTTTAAITMNASLCGHPMCPPSGLHDCRFPNWKTALSLWPQLLVQVTSPVRAFLPSRPLPVLFLYSPCPIRLVYHLALSGRVRRRHRSVLLATRYSTPSSEPNTQRIHSVTVPAVGSPASFHSKGVRLREVGWIV